jgi:hypothetical protein
MIRIIAFVCLLAAPAYAGSIKEPPISPQHPRSDGMPVEPPKDASWYYQAGHPNFQRDQPTTRFYDSRGNSTGTASTNSSGTTTFYDARGNVVGRSTK